MDIIAEEKQGLFKEVWRNHEPQIRKFCEYKLQSCPNDIEDVVADVFLYLWAEIENKGIPNNVRGWLYSVANNLIKQRYTACNKDKKRLVSFDDDRVVCADVGYDIDDVRFESEILYAWADDIVEKLSEEEQIILKFVYEEDLSMKEIAKRMSISADAVKQRHYRLIRKIKRLVRERIESN